MYLLNPAVAAAALVNILLLPETIVVAVLLLVLNIIFPTPAELALIWVNEDEVNPFANKTKEPLWSSKVISFNLSTSLKVCCPVNVFEPVVAKLLVFILPPPVIVTDAVPALTDALTPAPIKLNDVAFPNIVPSSCTDTFPPAELILVSKDAESFLYWEPENVCNKPIEELLVPMFTLWVVSVKYKDADKLVKLLVVAKVVFLKSCDAVYALKDAVVTKLPVSILLPVIANILLLKDALSALYWEPLNVCNKPTDVLILAVNVFVDCVYALKDAVVTNELVSTLPPLPVKLVAYILPLTYKFLLVETDTPNPFPKPSSNSIGVELAVLLLPKWIREI